MLKVMVEFKGQALSEQKGVTLVELLVALVVTGIILAGVVQVLVDNRMKFRLNNELAYIQENARFALDEMGRELREAGYSACSVSSDVANTINGSTTDDFFSGFGLEGWDSSEAASNFPSEFRDDLWSFGSVSNSDPDAFIVRKASTDNSYVVDSHNPSSAVIGVTGTITLDQGSILVAATPNCDQVSIFQYTGGNPGKFNHGTGGGWSPGNCTGSVYGNFDCTSPPAGNPSTFTPLPKGTRIMEFSANAYYIGASSIDTSIPSLYRERVQVTGSSPVTEAEELLVGVENMQLLYGVDTDGTQDGIANRYVGADAIDGTGNLEWERVTSVRIELLLRSLDPVWAEDTDFTFNGETYSDRMLRQRVSTSVYLRNLALVQ